MASQPPSAQERDARLAPPRLSASWGTRDELMESNGEALAPGEDSRWNRVETVSAAPVQVCVSPA